MPDEEITVPADQPDPPYLDSPLVEDDVPAVEEPTDEPEPMTAGEYLDPESERRP